LGLPESQAKAQYRERRPRELKILPNESKAILFITEWSTALGQGHYRRALTVAKWVRDAGHATQLFCVSPDHTGTDSPADCVFLADKKELSDRIRNDNGPPPAAVVLAASRDYSFLIEILRAKAPATKVLALDHVADSRLVADVNLYPNGHFDPLRLPWPGYKGQVISGAEYLVLSDEILAKRENLSATNKRQGLLVSFGSTDPNHLTVRYLAALSQAAASEPIKVVIGPGFENVDEVKHIQAKHSTQISVHEDLTSLADLIPTARLGITALGISIYEMAYLGMPTIVISNYIEDGPDELGLARYDGILPMGHFSLVEPEALANQVKRWLEAPDQLARRARDCQAITDGRGRSRIVDLVLKLAGHGQNNC